MKRRISRRFSGLLPVVLDCETGGLDPEKDALLEVAACVLSYQEDKLAPESMQHYHVEPFEGAHISQRSLEVTDIRPDHPFRFAVTETAMLKALSAEILEKCKAYRCRKAVLVGHNAPFDLSFMQAAYRRADLAAMDPFHRFVTLDTATMSGLWLRETVLAKAMLRRGVAFDVAQAHSALYDCEKTAELFCGIVNEMDQIRGF